MHQHKQYKYENVVLSTLRQFLTISDFIPITAVLTSPENNEVITLSKQKIKLKIIELVKVKSGVKMRILSLLGLLYLKNTILFKLFLNCLTLSARVILRINVKQTWNRTFCSRRKKT